MHFYCQCGNRINDTTDMISYKARMIADQDWFDLYQCVKCGRIFMEDQEHRLHTFSPEGTVEKRLLNSEKGSAWKGFLYASWDDEKPEWRNCHGMIGTNVNISYENLAFDAYEQFEARFYEIFEELKEKKLLRCAQLERNGKKIFDWDEDEG